jgi:hypothetical protein
MGVGWCRRSALGNSTVRLWDIVTRQLFYTFKGNEMFGYLGLRDAKYKSILCTGSEISGLTK